MTTRYVQQRTSLFLSFLLLLFPSVFTQLSPNQTRIMINLSKLLNFSDSSWNATRDPCSWKGVTCSSGNSSVTSLFLSKLGLSNSNFLPDVCKIETLQSLDLSNNRLSLIPDDFVNGCGRIDGLKLLNFSQNKLAGSLPTFNGFVGLESLDLSFNSLSGNVSQQLDGLLALKILNLSFNKFSGPLPVNLGKSLLLEKLQLSMNQFQGAIPQDIANCQNLNLLDLSGNVLDGSIPARIGNLTKLKFLVLSSNNLIGDIPANISNIPTLFRFAANQNQFDGRIPSGITRYLSLLDLSYNQLRGPIPADILSQSNLKLVDLSYNQLDGSIPSSISASLLRLRLGRNNFNGSIPSSFGKLEKLTYLELDENSLTGVIPPELGSCHSLALLNLAQNGLTGSVPTVLGNLNALQVLKLQHNRLDGEIPSEITRLQKLLTLNISWNSLTGSIPSSISNLQSLVHLNLQCNNLQGPIPVTVNSMNSLLELQLGQNKLNGTIPLMPVRLQISLNLSNNLFQGAIPGTLSRLKELEVLDLSNNNFSGDIPSSLTEMESLNQLILTNNQLSGVIPGFKPYVSLSAGGNAGLINSSATKTPQEPPKKGKSVAVTVMLAVVAAVLSAGVVSIIVVSLFRRFLKVNNQQSQSGEELPPPQVIEGNLLTTNGIHRSNIDFTKAMEIAANPLNIELKTRFSTYYKATMPSGASYFVKKLNWSDKIFQLGSHHKFGQELEVLGKLSNTNVMTPLAYVLSTDSAYLFYEYAEKGTLFDVLHGKLGDALDWASRYSIAVGVAQGLTFLHGCTSGPILLLDLSSQNILLKSLKEPVVGDIELHKVIDPTKSTSSLSTIAGSVGYIPPEYAYTMRVTMAGNVYSFGVVLLELLTGKPAVSEGTELAKWVLSKSAQKDRRDHILDSNISRTSPAVRGQMLAVLKIALSCVSVSTEARPKMKNVLRMILTA
ncbi:leucine-rich repeat family protein [Salix suchowensis]|nr:leucine-rich repeat family protein [Salix suchowensis]